MNHKPREYRVELISEASNGEGNEWIKVMAYSAEDAYFQVNLKYKTLKLFPYPVVRQIEPAIA